MRTGVRDGRGEDLHVLQEELKRLGITVISGRQDTVISVKIKGLAGRGLIRGLRLADQLLQEKIKCALKACIDPDTKLFTDPTFGPSSSDPDGAAAMCKTGSTIPSKGGSQHQAKVLGLLQKGKLRWERPIYAMDNAATDSPQDDDEDDIYAMAQSDNVFASNAMLFADGVSSGDVIQGNLGDCWFLSALSVVATRSDVLEQTFWRKDQYKSTGLFVCKFMKNFVWNYVLIDDRLPVFGFSDKKAGKPYFARCRNPDELWVSLLEKAYAKLHGSYEALIGGFVDCALNDLTGMCSEQVILKDGFPGFGENPYTPAKPQQKHGDPFWEKITRYKQSGTLMGCSIQPPVTSSKDVAVESSAGNGLYFKHAYALVDAAEIKTVKGEYVRLVKLRNPWGMGEWTGPWSDSSEERTNNEDPIENFFKIMKRRVGANAEKRVFMTLSAQGKVGADEISQEEVIEINANDGTFFMSFDAWMQSFTHFFAGIDFPDAWHGRRSEGSWNEANCGGNTTKSTWINNPHFELVLEQRARVFISLSQEDPRGSQNLKIVPVGFHICSLSPVNNEGNKVEIREPVKKLDAYYRLYKPAERDNFQTGKRPELLPPAIIPGTVIPGIDDDGVPQPAYTFKQAVSTEAVMEPGRYCIIPSMYMRTDKVTGNTNVGSFWVSVYSDKPTFRLQGGEKIVEEEEGEEEAQVNGSSSKMNGSASVDGRISTSSLGKKSDTMVTTGNAIAAEKRRRYEREKEELLRQAKRYGIGIQDLRAEFSKVPKIQKAECRQKLQKLGFNVATWDDEKMVLLFGGVDDSPAIGVIYTDRILKLFTPDNLEEKMACELPDMEEDGDSPNSIHREGILEIELHGASGLDVCGTRQSLIQRKIQVSSLEFSPAQSSLRRRIALEILERDSSMAWNLRHFAAKSALLVKSRFISPVKNRDAAKRSSQHLSLSPVSDFYVLLEKEYALRLLSRINTQDDLDDSSSGSRTPIYTQNNEQPSPFYQVLPPKGNPKLMLSTSSSDAIELHKSNRIRDLELKRSEKLAVLLQQKQQALGDAEKTSALPRLIGGRKSGSNHVKCCDCGARVLVSGRGCLNISGSERSSSYSCTGANCVSVFCSCCYSLLPVTSKLCEACFQHEITPEEALGEQLRVVLIEKIGASDQQRTHFEEIFRSFDVDGSGALSAQEFEKMLQLLSIQPALTQGQKTFLIDQFDANGDGEISLMEFKNWILGDRVWEESPAIAGNQDNKIQTAAEVFDSVITPIREEILDLAYEAYRLSTTLKSWSHSANSMSKSLNNLSLKGETGIILFERVLSLEVASSAAINASEKMFEQVDSDASGTIDQFEFSELLTSLGIDLSSEDAKLLRSRLKSSPASDGNSTITRSAFMSYVEQTSIQSKSGKTTGHLKGVLVCLDELARSGANIREILQSELQHLHENMSEKDKLMICKALEEKAEIVVDVDDVHSLAMNLSFHLEASVSSSYFTTSGTNAQLVSYKSSGDLLARGLLSESSDLMIHVKDFDVATGCVDLATHLQTRSGTNSTSSIWRTVFATNTSHSVFLSDFLSGILRTGFSLVKGDNSSTQTGQLLTQLLLSIIVDAVRSDCQPQDINIHCTEASVSYTLFKMIMRLQQIKDIELKFQHALVNFLQLSQGEQQYIVTIGLDFSRNLIIRVRDPIRKFSAEFILREDEYDCQNLLSQVQNSEFERRLQETHDNSREFTFSASPHGLITGEFYPDLNKSMLAILGRLRVDFRHRSSNSHRSRANALILSLVESDTFVITLRSLLSQVDLPFFWCVSSRCLSLSIDSEFLDQQEETSFQQLVADSISVRGSQSSTQLRALATFVSHTASSLLVRYQVVGKYTNVETSWQEFQEFVAGHQDAYAVIELRPQGSLYTTRVARATGSGAVQWSFKTQIPIEEPKICDSRIDRPVVFTDTVKVMSIPGSTGSTDNTSFIVGDKGENLGHFVVVSVRRALPSGPESPKLRLYCTAYDPLTSCDYTVEGYPSDWPIDFFDVITNPSFESRWQEMLSTMKLGVTITPKLCVTVFNKQPKSDKLIGECEVSVGSAITLEGQIFEERITLQPSTSLTTPNVAGVTALTFRFDVKKASTMTFDPSKRRTLQHTTGTAVPIKHGAKYLAGEILTPRTEPVYDMNDQKLQQLQTSIASIELAKLEAQDKVRQLTVQVQQLMNASTKASNEVSERWKRRFEQARQEQFATEEEQATRLNALQQELRKVTEEKDKHVNAPREASNLKDCRLSAEASAHDILEVIKAILTCRCPERPYNGLKKALAAEAEVPGKVTFAVFNDVLCDFGLGISSEHRTTLCNLLDPDMIGRVSIEDFFINLCGDAEAYAMLKTSRSQSPSPVPDSPVPSEEPDPVAFTPHPPVQRPVSPISSPLRGSSVRSKMNWQDMKKFLVLNLPEGWETRFTEKGRPYFCSHANRSTQWKHPRAEIETIFSEWVQANGAYFNRKPPSTRASKQKH